MAHEIVISRMNQTAAKSVSDWIARLRPFLAAIATGAAYFAGAKVGFALTFQTRPVSTLWPPNSILMAALLLTPARWWWLIMVTVLPAHLLAELGSGVPLPMVLCWFVSNTAEALIGAVFLRSYSNAPLKFDTVHRVAVFCGAALIAPFLSSFLDAGFVLLNKWGAGTYWQIWRMRFFSNVLAEITLVPVIILWVTEGAASLRRITFWRGVETLALALSLLGVVVPIFGQPAGAEVFPELLYIPLPILLWAAVRFGPKGLSTCLLVVTMLAIWNATAGRGPFATHSPETNALSIQLFLVLAGPPLMFLAALICELGHTRAQARETADHLAMALNAAEMGTWTGTFARTPPPGQPKPNACLAFRCTNRRLRRQYFIRASTLKIC